jgi:riboflavin synthase alpha subunit
MFTGLIREVGVLRRRRSGAGLVRLAIAAPRSAPGLNPGDSLAVDGICLTVTRCRGPLVEVEAAAETLRTTTLSGWRVGRRLHLEPSLRAGEPLDGHLVLGHVDGTGRVAAARRAGESLLVTVVCGEELARWLIPKGSVAVDGVSLTVDAGPHADRFTVNLVPHTLRWTDLASVRTGRLVNLEMDVLVKAARTGRPAAAFGALAATGAGTGVHVGAGVPAVPAATVPSVDAILSRGFARRGAR